MKKGILKEYAVITLSTLVISAGIYFFKFPNDFTFGGVSGLAVVLGRITTLSPGSVNFVLNALLVICGFLFLGKNFGIKTVYTSFLLSGAVWILERLVPMTKPLTDDPMLELVFAVLLPAFGSALLFHAGASSGGTDIIAMILKRYTSVDIGRALFISDFFITMSSFLVFSIKTALFSCLGLLAKSLIVDSVIESINLNKYFNVICSEPEPILDYIVKKLDRSATVCDAVGAYSHHHKYIIFTVMNRAQAVQLRRFIRSVEPDAFLLVCNTSEIIGRGFHSE
ncbi:YitT family protein [Caproiciproducens sp. NJN-50]|uniref:YitT family protein n=1 Tax=Acutalibacteraceae TaxID=3082771 RepID=UPI000FFE1B14|nr:MULTISPECIES: YitT family protein [Acutalibacteraceae]QAT50597.1 YitT family protein [Caproiciproducens sp. NJN-50]